MSDVMFAIDLAVTKGVLDGKPLGTDEEIRAAFDAVLAAYARGTMNVLSMDSAYRVGTGALLLEAEKRKLDALAERLRGTAESIKALNAAMSGVPVDFAAVQLIENLLPLKEAALYVDTQFSEPDAKALRYRIDAALGEEKKDA
jgi:hypothetical protein